MSWDEYTEAVLRLSMPDGDIEVAPASLGGPSGPILRSAPRPGTSSVLA